MGGVTRDWGMEAGAADVFACVGVCSYMCVGLAEEDGKGQWGGVKLMFIESVMPSNHLILCCPFLLLLP